MATLINDIETWSKYSEIRTAIIKGDSRGDEPAIPKNIRQLFDRETMLTPADLSSDLLRELFLTQCRTFIPSYEVDNLNGPVIDAFIMYLKRDEHFKNLSSSYKFGRGLLLRGNIGVGKTVLFKSLKKLLSGLRFFISTKQHIYYNDTDAFNIITSNKIAEMYSIDGFEIFSNGYNPDRKTGNIDLVSGTLFIDDLGSEPIVSHYGTTVNILAELLIRRYELGKITHATSNLGVDDLKKLYGLRVFDRMREMFNDITLKGESRRK
jgi:hypothetical protein